MGYEFGNSDRETMCVFVINTKLKWMGSGWERQISVLDPKALNE